MKISDIRILIEDMSNMVPVKNLTGTSNKACHCDSWLDHWYTFSGKQMTWCSIEDCHGEAEVGAHVIRADKIDREHYIVPICQSHNKQTGIFKVPTSYLVSANVSNTCGNKI